MLLKTCVGTSSIVGGTVTILVSHMLSSLVAITSQAIWELGTTMILQVEMDRMGYKRL